MRDPERRKGTEPPNTKLSNCPNVLKFAWFGSKICIVSINICFKGIHHLQSRENLHFLLLILRLYIGYRLDQTLSTCKCMLVFKKLKVLKYKDRSALHFQNFTVFFCACVRTMLKIVLFVTRKMKLMSFSFLCSPRPDALWTMKCRFIHMYIYSICKGRLGSRRREGAV